MSRRTAGQNPKKNDLSPLTLRLIYWMIMYPYFHMSLLLFHGAQII